MGKASTYPTVYYREKVSTSSNSIPAFQATERRGCLAGSHMWEKPQVRDRTGLGKTSRYRISWYRVLYKAVLNIRKGANMGITSTFAGLSTQTSR